MDRHVSRCARIAPLILVPMLCWGCLGGFAPGWTPSGGLLWDEGARVGIPDLTLQGWERARIDESDLAFRRPGADVIAMRLRCDQAESAASVPLRWQSRELWLGIPRSDFGSREFRFRGRPAIEMTASSDGVAVRTLVIDAGGACRLDLAHAASISAADATADFERFLADVQIRDLP